MAVKCQKKKIIIILFSHNFSWTRLYHSNALSGLTFTPVSFQTGIDLLRQHLPTSLSEQVPCIAHLEQTQIPRIHPWAICKTTPVGAGVEYSISNLCFQEEIYFLNMRLINHKVCAEGDCRNKLHF